MKMLGRLKKDQRGITGLETAIILIAFVVVASVFAYTVLSAGLFASEKGKETVYSGMSEVKSSFVTKGNTVAYKSSVDTDGDMAGDTDAVVKVSLTVGTALQGEPIDLTPTHQLDSINDNLESSGLSNSLFVTYLDNEQLISDMAWTVVFNGANDGDYSLEPTEKATITVWLVDYKYDAVEGLYYSLGTDSTDPFIDSADNLLTRFQTFSVELNPVQGNTLTIEKTVPQSLNDIMNLH